jgi:hypothetical protein
MEAISSHCASIRKAFQLLNLLTIPNGLRQRLTSKKTIAFFRSSKNERK